MTGVAKTALACSTERPPESSRVPPTRKFLCAVRLDPDRPEAVRRGRAEFAVLLSCGTPGDRIRNVR